MRKVQSVFAQVPALRAWTVQSVSSYRCIQVLRFTVGKYKPIRRQRHFTLCLLLLSSAVAKNRKYVLAGLALKAASLITVARKYAQQSSQVSMDLAKVLLHSGILFRFNFTWLQLNGIETTEISYFSIGTLNTEENNFNFDFHHKMIKEKESEKLETEKEILSFI